MTKSIYEIDMMRKELHELAEIQRMGIGPQARKATHDRMLLVAFQLQEALEQYPNHVQQTTTIDGTGQFINYLPTTL